MGYFNQDGSLLCAGFGGGERRDMCVRKLWSEIVLEVFVEGLLW